MNSTKPVLIIKTGSTLPNSSLKVWTLKLGSGWAWGSSPVQQSLPILQPDSQGLRLGKCAWGVQFHPEFSADISEHYVQIRWDDMVAEGLQPQRILDQEAETP